jgi:uncharacterized membrane protein YtjA (UPF0391 family)
MKTTSHQLRYPVIAFWAAMLAFCVFLVSWEGKSGTRLVSLPGIFLSLGMLCWLAQGLAPAKDWLGRLLYVAALILFAVSLVLSAGFLLKLI